MMKRSIPALVLALAAGLTASAHASVDASPKPGGVYPLKPGLYVATGSTCAAPPNPALRLYDGKGIGSARTHACKASVRKRAGKTYTVRQTCIDAGSGPAPRFTETQTLVIRDALHFRQTVGKRSASYRYCPAHELPEGLRRHAREPGVRVE